MFQLFLNTAKTSSFYIAKIITVFNKMDKVDIESLVFENKDVGEKIFVSGKDNLNLDVLLEMIEENLPQVYRDVTLMIPYDSQTLVNYFLENYEVEHIEYLEGGTELKLNINQIDYKKYIEYIID